MGVDAAHVRFHMHRGKCSIPKTNTLQYEFILFLGFCNVSENAVASSKRSIRSKNLSFTVLAVKEGLLALLQKLLSQFYGVCSV